MKIRGSFCGKYELEGARKIRGGKDRREINRALPCAHKPRNSTKNKMADEGLTIWVALCAYVTKNKPFLRVPNFVKHYRHTTHPLRWVAFVRICSKSTKNERVSKNWLLFIFQKNKNKGIRKQNILIAYLKWIFTTLHRKTNKIENTKIWLY